MKGPDGDVLERGHLLHLATAGERNNARPARRIGGGETPRAVAAHRPTGQRDATRINAELLRGVIENCQRALSVGRATLPRFQDAAFRRFALRENHDERKRLRPRLHEWSQPNGELHPVLDPPLTRSMQEQNRGRRLVHAMARRKEHDVLVFASLIAKDLIDKATGRILGKRARRLRRKNKHHHDRDQTPCDPAPDGVRL